MGTSKVLRIQHVKDKSGPFVSDNPHVKAIVDSVKLPAPHEDKGFDQHAVKRLRDESASPIKFAFKDEDQMKRTFSDDHLATLKQHGYAPTWVPAKDIWGSDHQVMYTTHEGDQKHADKLTETKARTKYKEYTPEEIANMNKSLEKNNEPKSDFKGHTPSREGSHHNEVHEFVHVNGQRSISGAAEDRNTGDHKYFRRKVDNKVKTTHVWDANKKQWNHKKTEHTLGGLNVDGTPKSSKQNAVTPMDVAHKKAKEAEAARGGSEGPSRPKTITRKAIKKCEDILNKLKELKKGMDNSGLGGLGSVKAGMSRPTMPKLPKPGNNSATPSVNVAQPSKKNPMKVAEQTHNKDIKDIKMKEAQAQMKGPEMVKFEKNGQWKIDHADQEEG